MVLLSSCSSNSLFFNKERLVKKQNKGYFIYVNDKLVLVKNYFLTNTSLIIEEEKRIIKIYKPGIKSLKNLLENKYKNLKEIGVIIIDGIVYDKKFLKDIYIEESLIKNLRFLDPAFIKSQVHFHNNKLILIVSTKIS
ncbi:hypothetical protein [Polaribacter ponticola]|uniref:Lipoprotein n=1 Tax=Polaribacter ponticola TaxID=2978475 RepID=A0ABT5SA70_9FLAO|nr:hypothetical protein [Polaribacter sp. MSW5]MDD7915007.1 hypothetical protein [Polaribacter sp. MSW5]